MLRKLFTCFDVLSRFYDCLNYPKIELYMIYESDLLFRVFIASELYLITFRSSQFFRAQNWRLIYIAVGINSMVVIRYVLRLLGTTGAFN